MQFRQLGKSGIEASAVGLGAWAIGGWMWGGQDDRESIRGIQAAIDEGINFIDTAPVYGFGRSEEIVAAAIKGRRGRLVIATKCGLRWGGTETRQGAYHFSSDSKGLKPRGAGDREVFRYLGPESIREEVEQSLRRLGIETIDLYQTHWQDPTTSIGSTMEALLRLKEEGKIRAIGVSNANVQQLQEYIEAGVVDSDQEKYSMLDRDLESGQLPFCRKRKIAFLAYSPLANGVLTGKIGPDRQFGEGDLRLRHPRFSVENRRRISRLLEDLSPVADGRGLTLAQLAIAWTTAQPGVTHALVGVRNPEQARANARAGSVVLSKDDLSNVESILEAHAGELV